MDILHVINVNMHEFVHAYCESNRVNVFNLLAYEVPAEGALLLRLRLCGEPRASFEAFALRGGVSECVEQLPVDLAKSRWNAFRQPRVSQTELVHIFDQNTLMHPPPPD